jgi:hypothetical protein
LRPQKGSKPTVAITPTRPKIINGVELAKKMCDLTNVFFLRTLAIFYRQTCCVSKSQRGSLKRRSQISGRNTRTRSGSLSAKVKKKKNRCDVSKCVWAVLLYIYLVINICIYFCSLSNLINWYSFYCVRSQKPNMHLLKTYFILQNYDSMRAFWSHQWIIPCGHTIKHRLIPFFTFVGTHMGFIASLLGIIPLALIGFVLNTL